MSIEALSQHTLHSLTAMILKLWPECDYDTELANCQRMLSSNTETAFLEKDNETYIGFIYMSLRSEHVEGTSTKPVAYIEGIYIEPEYRHKGIARKLVERGEQWGIDRGCKEMASDTETHNHASIAFHTKLGFEEVNRVVLFRKDLMS